MTTTRERTAGGAGERAEQQANDQAEKHLDPTSPNTSSII
jgi:hypothetical protein